MRLQINKAITVFTFFFTTSLFPALALAEQDKEMYPGMETGWTFPFSGGYVHQFDIDLDDGGNFRADRLYIQGGSSYALEPMKSVSFTIGYGFDGYDFSADTQLAAETPWDDIHSLRFSAPVRWGIDRTWSFFAVPTVRVTAENGADLDKAFTGGGFAGFAYRFSDELTIGPGLGILTQLEESATVFPFLLVKWNITEDLSLQTGGGLAATLGPGLTLNWKPSSRWEFVLGGRYEKLRFRLDRDGENPGGIGEDRTFPLFIGATYSFDHTSKISIIGGMELGGELRIEDRDGRFLRKDHYEPAPFLGITFSYRL